MSSHGPVRCSHWVRLRRGRGLPSTKCQSKQIVAKPTSSSTPFRPLSRPVRGQESTSQTSSGHKLVRWRPTSITSAVGAPGGEAHLPQDGAQEYVPKTRFILEPAKTLTSTSRLTSFWNNTNTMMGRSKLTPKRERCSIAAAAVMAVSWAAVPTARTA